VKRAVLSVGSLMRSKRVRFWFNATVSLALIGLVVWLTDVRSIFRALREVDGRILILAYLAPMFGLSITSIRWKGLLRARGFRLHWRSLFASCMSAMFFKQFLPSSLAADAVRMFDTWRAGVDAETSFATVVIGRLFGFFVLTLFAAGSALLSPTIQEHVPQLVFIGPLAAIGFAMILATALAPMRFQRSLGTRFARLLPAKIERMAHKVGLAFGVYRHKPWTLASTFGWSVLLQLNAVLYWVLLGRALGLDPSPWAYVAAVPVAYFVMTLPISINAVGVREAVIILMLGSFGVSKDHAVAFAWIEFGGFLVTGVIGGLVHIARGSPRADRKEDVSWG